MSAPNAAVPQALAIALGRGMGDPERGRVRARHQIGGGDLAAEEPAGQLDGVDDLHVARAAAQVAAQRPLDLGPGRARVRLQQLLGRHDHAGDAEAALDRAGQDERLLDQVRPIRRAQALDRRDLRALERGDPGDAREDGLAVDEDHAGAALALAVARLLGPGQAEVLPDQVEQDGLLLVGHDLDGSTVDGEGDLLHETLVLRDPRLPVDCCAGACGRRAHEWPPGGTLTGRAPGGQCRISRIWTARDPPAGRPRRPGRHPARPRLPGPRGRLQGGRRR